jgi:predicted nucleic acid-binding protein
VLLVDSSVWVLADRRKISLSELLPVDEIVATCPIIAQEILRGTQNAKHYGILRQVLFQVEMLDSPTPFERFEEAAQVFLRCRDFGVTPRSSVDCVIIATALAHDLTVVHSDRDFKHAARALPLRTLNVNPESSARS